ncbi:helix-hairpin-helix domain-containing protein [Gangjinia marincola]|uniref:Helix-hairpin-helix domain-containing protein n=1 Tax=Gangjinia marincola TaxID=578463 RepID=A0ABN1MDM6_9FLAO
MKNIKSHFSFDFGQRNGIFLLVLLIIVVQLVYFFYPFASAEENKSQFSQEDIEQFKVLIDSLEQQKIEDHKPKQFPFNPNYITDYKGYTLGMSVAEIDRLHAYRDSGKWVNSKQDFQRVTQVSDSLLNTFAHLFKFPDWVTNPSASSNTFKRRTLSYNQKQDLNKASASDLEKVVGIGPYFAGRIIAYREELGGFSAPDQLKDIERLDPQVITKLLETFAIKTPKKIDKQNLNILGVPDLIKIPGMDYETARIIVNYRKEVRVIQSFEELKKIEDFPVEKLDRIKLYLQLN